MKKHQTWTGIIVLFLLLNACAEDETASSNIKKENYLIFGSYYGECLDNCVNIYYLKPEEKELFKASEPTYPKYEVNSFPYGLHFNALSTQQYTQAEALMDAVPSQLLSENKLVIGEPDSFDQGGVYVEVQNESGIHKYYIDTNKESIPEYLHDFVDAILETVTLLRTNEN